MRKYKLVPVEPTEEMVNAAEDYMEFIDTTGEVWGAMLAAAPRASQDEELVEKLRQLLTDMGLVGYCAGYTVEVDSEDARAVLKMLEGGE